MKFFSKNVILALCLFMPSASFAQNKRLSSMEVDWGWLYNQAFFSYDEQDRVTQIQYSEDGNTRTVTYTYDGEDKIAISLAYSSGTDTFEYNLSNGKVQSGNVYLDADLVNKNYSFTYDGDRLSNIGIEQTKRGNAKKESFEYTWVKGNPTNVVNYYEGELDISATNSFNSIVTHPLIHVLFGGICAEMPADIEEMIPLFALYNKIGSIPQNLIESYEEYDYSEKRSFLYGFNYELDSEGLVSEIVAIRGNNSYKYRFTWEDATNDISSVTKSQSIPLASYNINGQKVSGSKTKGLRITRYSDGRVCKTIVK